MSKDEFTKLFQYLQRFKHDVDARFEEARLDRNEIKNTVAELGINFEDLRNEFYALSRKVDRLENKLVKS